MSGDVTPESLVAQLRELGRLGWPLPAAAADRITELEAAEVKLARVREWRQTAIWSDLEIEGRGGTYDGFTIDEWFEAFDAILDDANGPE